MALQKKDFIEIEFTGKIKEGEIFDSNIKEDLAKIDSKAQAKPLIFSLGQGMFLQGVEDFLIGKNLGEFEIELSAENAFGKRNPSLIKKIPIKIFHEQKLNPVPGATFNFDGGLGKVLTASGGRVIVDFNNPLAGKDIIYNVKVLRTVEDLDQKIKALLDFFFRKDLKFEVKDKTLIVEAPKEMMPFINVFKDKFKEMLSLDLEVKEEVSKESVGKK